LLPINDTTILGKQLDNISRVGLSEVIISAGHKVEKIETHVSQLNLGLSIKIEYNPFFDISNNIISFWNIRHLIRNESIVILNGDTVFHYTVLKKLLDTGFDNVLMIREKDEYNGEDMKIQADKNRLLAINKSMKSSVATAESIGIMKFSAHFTNLLLNKSDMLIRDRGNHQALIFRAMQEIIDEGQDIYVCSIGQLPWAEVDYPKDYDTVLATDWD